MMRMVWVATKVTVAIGGYKEYFTGKGFLAEDLAQIDIEGLKEILPDLIECSDEKIYIIMNAPVEYRGLYISHFRLQAITEENLKIIKEFLEHFSHNKIFISPHIQQKISKFSGYCESFFPFIIKLSNDTLNFRENRKEICAYLETIDKQIGSWRSRIRSEISELDRVFAARLFPEEVGGTKKEKQNDA